MHRISRLMTVLTIVHVLAITMHGQANEPNQTPTFTLRTGTNLVIVDVGVTDQQGHPVRNLKPQDFTLMEDGRSQHIRHVEEHSSMPADSAHAAPQPKLQRGLFTNYVPTPATGPVNILLLDTLNTALQDQAFVRTQLAEFLRKAPAGTQIAIFGLNTQLNILQGFTSNPEILKAALAKKGTSQSSSLLNDPLGGGGENGAGASSSSEALATLGSTPDILQTVANVQQFEAQQESFQFQLRVQYTLDALNELARYLVNIPGRKNLIWFSGSFPVDILPNGDMDDPFHSAGNNEAEFRETVNLLTRSQVAVYPIDARGLMTSPGYSASNSGSKYATNPQAASKDALKFSMQNAQESGTMRAMADDTGGRAFLNTNGLSDAVAAAVADGSNYYTLTYTPGDMNWDGRFRKISVALAEKGYHVSYRRGYYADDPNKPAVSHGDVAAAATVPAAKSTLTRTMMRGAPTPTQIVFTVRVLPATSGTETSLAPGNTLSQDAEKIKGPYRRLAVDFALNARDFAFEHEGDFYKDDISFLTFVYDQSGTLVDSLGSTLHAKFDTKVYANVIRAPFSYNEDVSVPATGQYFLRIAIQDLNSNRVGAIEVPVSSVLGLPPIDAASAQTKQDSR